MRRFDIPATPSGPGWRGGELIRIVEPTGRAIAWVDPSAGRCVGYAVRPAMVTIGGWQHLFQGQARPTDARVAAYRLGMGVAWPWPDEAPPDTPVRWRLIERDPTAATCACHCVSVSDPTQDATLILTVLLDGATLQCVLRVQRSGGSTELPQPGMCLVLPGRCRIPGSGLAIDRHTSTGALLKLCCDDSALQLTVGSAPPDCAYWSFERDDVDNLVCMAQIVPLPPGTSQPSPDQLTISLCIS